MPKIFIAVEYTEEIKDTILQFFTDAEALEKILIDGKVHNVSVNRIIEGIGFTPEQLPELIKMYKTMFNNKNNKDGN